MLYCNGPGVGAGRLMRPLVEQAFPPTTSPTLELAGVIEAFGVIRVLVIVVIVYDTCIPWRPGGLRAIGVPTTANRRAGADATIAHDAGWGYCNL